MFKGVELSLESLFDSWKQKTTSDEMLKGRPFIRDGVIDETV